MTYVNPFELLEISSADAKSIKKAKTKKLAAIQLSEEGYILYGTLKVDKSQLLHIVDELSDPKKKEYHLIIANQPNLLRFLSFGELTFFEAYQEYKIYSSRPFQNFIAPHYIEAFSTAYLIAYNNEDVYILKKMLEPPLMIPRREKASLLKKVERKVEHLYEDLNSFYMNSGYPGGKPSTAEAFLAKAKENWKVELLNALPKQFEDVRTKLAVLLKNMALKVHRSYTENNELTALELLEAALELKIRASTKQSLRRELNTLSRKLRLKREEQEKLLKVEIKQMISQLRAIRQHLAIEHKFRPNIVNDINRIVDFEKVNKLPANLSNLKNELASEISQIALFVWDLSEDLNLFNTILNKALEIELDESQSEVIAKLRKRQKKEEKVKQPSPNFDLLIMALEGVQEKINQGRRRRDGMLKASKLTGLLFDLFRPDTCVALMKPEHKEYRLKAFQLLLPILHFVRREDPIEVLKFLENIEDLVKSDADFLQKIEEMGDQILEELKNPKKQKKQHKKRKRIKRHPLERIPFWQKVSDAFHNLKVYLFDEGNSGSDRAVQLAVIASLGAAVIISFAFILPMLYKPHVVQREELISSEPVAFSYESINRKFEFEERKSEFIGNQLETGELPFPLCFGENEVVSGSGNTVFLRNRSTEDVVAVLYTKDTLRTEAHAYIRAGESTAFRKLPSGEYKFRFYVGKDWNPLKPNFCGLHGAFDTNPHYLHLSRYAGPTILEGNTRFTLVLDPKAKVTKPETGTQQKKFIKISAGGFFYSRNEFPDAEPDLGW